MQAKRDLGRKIAEDLLKIHSIYRTADEAYRRFRKLLLDRPPPPGHMPIEWIPVSDN